jgi:hypothetical protein
MWHHDAGAAAAYIRFQFSLADQKATKSCITGKPAVIPHPDRIGPDKRRSRNVARTAIFERHTSATRNGNSVYYRSLRVLISCETFFDIVGTAIS